MKLSRTTIHVCPGTGFRAPAGSRTGVSLHSHSECSREALDFVPGIARRIPLIATLFEWSVASYQRDNGRPLDFSSVYWRPPLAPAARRRIGAAQSPSGSRLDALSRSPSRQ